MTTKQHIGSRPTKWSRKGTILTIKGLCTFAISILMTCMGHRLLFAAETLSTTTSLLSAVSNSTCNIAHVRLQSFYGLPNSPHTRITIHIVREYGPASFGGMGAALTALMTSMAALSTQSVVIAILPAYPFLLRDSTFKVVGKALGHDGSTNGHVYARKDDKRVLILPLEMFEPLKFHAEAIDDIYDERLTTDKHACFNMFAAMVVSVLSKRFPYTSVHVHGSLNGLIPTLLRLDRETGTPRKVIYTMHDVSSEFESGIPSETIKRGWSAISTPLSACPVLRGEMCMTMGLGIRDADAVTGVSQGLITHLLKSQCDECEILRRRNQTFVTGIPWTVHAHEAHGATDTFAQKVRAKEALCSTLGKARRSQCLMAPMIGFVGRFERLKGADVVFLLLDQCREMNQVYGTITIGIVGLPSREPVSTRIMQLLSSMPDTCIVFSATSRKEQNDIGDEIRHAIDVQVAPSMSEGFGLVLLEAIKAGAYPVASHNPGFTDILDQRDAFAAVEKGFFVPCDAEHPSSWEIIAMVRSALAAATIAVQQTQAPAHIAAGFSERFPSQIMQHRLLSARYRARKLACAKLSEGCRNLPIISLSVPEAHEHDFQRQLMSLCVGSVRFLVISTRDPALSGNGSCIFFSMRSLKMDNASILLAADASISLGSSHLVESAGRSGSCPIAETHTLNLNRNSSFASMGILLTSRHYLDFVWTAAGTAYLLNAMSDEHRQKMLRKMHSYVDKKFGSWGSMQGPAGRYIRFYDALAHG